MPSTFVPGPVRLSLQIVAGAAAVLILLGFGSTLLTTDQGELLGELVGRLSITHVVLTLPCLGAMMPRNRSRARVTKP
ncbi:MAG: hypothetical protein EB084_11850 [Proteobacteria bacterium]|nr:hypothetical protein [Pseudomonadota bacterium]